MPKPKGGRVEGDNKPRTSGPGPYSQRTDLVAGKQPIRLPGGQPYGDRQLLEGAQQAIPLQQGGPMQPTQAGASGVPQGAAGGQPEMAPTDVAAMLGHDSQNPGEPVTTAPGSPSPPDVVNASKLAGALEPIVQSGPVSQSLMDFYLNLRQQARLPDVMTRNFPPGQPIDVDQLR